jgi:hypothetical protein
MESEIRGNYKVWIATIYLFLVSGFLYLKPALAFGEEGRIRPFGVGDREKTVFPLWWWMFILAVASYMIVMFLVKFEL